jgi:hypothetical protein
VPNDEIIVINPKPPGGQNNVQTQLSREATIAALRETADQLEAGAPMDSEAEDDRA